MIKIQTLILLILSLVLVACERNVETVGEAPAPDSAASSQPDSQDGAEPASAQAEVDLYAYRS